MSFTLTQCFTTRQSSTHVVLDAGHKIGGKVACRDAQGHVGPGGGAADERLRGTLYRYQEVITDSL